MFETVVGDVQTLSAPDIIKQINDSNIDILWVGLLSQTRYLDDKNKLLLKVNGVVGVGVAFKFESEVRRAPKVVRDWGLNG